ncbi:protein of unknown function [Xenorhabdus bovienii]|uniref:Uncharacterized protein n=1 Tax=Xenorhabdus bovienii TaxID=40576 RepID=A0A0B6X4P0_XENBV|nr:protein of unknown function [Xenorhabdus bovienii]
MAKWRLHKIGNKVFIICIHDFPFFLVVLKHNANELPQTFLLFL